jgi:fructokinase
MLEESSIAKGSPPRVLCFGEALVDRLGPLEDRLGGAPANVACALARLGTPVAFLGRLGDDAIGAAFAALFAERGVDTRGLQIDPDRPSRIVLVHRDACGERSFGGFSGERGQGFADQAVDAGELAADVDPLLAQAQWLLVGTIPLATAASAAALERVVALAAERGIPLAVDVNWRPTFWGFAAEAPPSPLALQRIRPLLEQASLIKCAAQEAEACFGTMDPLALQAELPRRPAVLITDGGQPLRWCLGGCTGTLDVFSVPVVDTTGAGDAFTAGVLQGLCRKPALLHGAASDAGAPADPGPVRELLRFASACGAIVCGGFGAIDPQPTAAEVKAFLQQQP